MSTVMLVRQYVRRGKLIADISLKPLTGYVQDTYDANWDVRWDIQDAKGNLLICGATGRFLDTLVDRGLLVCVRQPRS